MAATWRSGPATLGTTLIALPSAPPPPLSPREERSVALLAGGCTDTVVGRRPAVSERTVTATVRALMDRYDARSRFQLALRLSQRR